MFLSTLSVSLQTGHTVSHLSLLHTNMFATHCIFLLLSLFVCQLGKVSIKWAESKQCPWYPGQNSQCPTADVLPPPQLMCGQPSLFTSTLLPLPPSLRLLVCSSPPLLLWCWPLLTFFPTNLIPLSRRPSRCPSFPAFLSSPPLPISPHQEEPNRKSKFLVEEWSGA